MKHRKLGARLLSIALTVAMTCTMLPATVLAAGGNEAPDASSMACHKEHDANCGYVEAVDAIPATAEIPCDKACVGEHTADCAYRAAAEEVPAVMGADCKHSCDTCNPPEESNAPKTMAETRTASTVASWTALQDALNAGGEITLGNDITAEASDAALQIPAGITVTLDLAGHTLSRGLTEAAVNGNVMTVAGTLTLKNTGDSDNGKITGGKNGSSGGGVCVTSSGSFTMEGGTISGNTVPNPWTDYYGGGVYVKGGTFIMNGGTISGNTIRAGGGVGVEGGSFTMNGGTVSGNTSSNGGGGVYLVSGTFIMNDGAISNNTTAAVGGGVYAYGGSFTMNGGTISDNTANNGGGVYTGILFTMNSGTISGNNAAGGSGGGISAAYTFAMKGGTISGNTARFGGGVYVSFSVSIAGASKIQNNTAGTPEAKKTNNLFLQGKRNIGYSAPLAGNAQIGVTRDGDKAGAITFAKEEWTNYVGNFTSDNEAFQVRYNASDKTLSLADVPSIAPKTATFDNNPTATTGYADVTVTQTLNDNTLTEIKNGGTVLTENTDYTISGDTVTIKKEYLGQRPVGTTNLTFVYNFGAKSTLAITVWDSRQPFITVGAQSSTVSYGTVGNATFTVTPTNFGGTYPVFAPSIEWVTTSHDGVTATISGSDVTVTTTATAAVGDYKFKVLSAKDPATGGNYESAEVTFKVDKVAYSGAELTLTKSQLINTAGVRNATLTAADFTTLAGAKITAISGTTYNVVSGTPSLSNGTITYTTQKVNAVASDTYTVTISTTNYTDITAMLIFSAISKTAVVIGGDVAISGLTEGKVPYNGSPVVKTGTPTATAGGTPVTISEYTYTYIGTGSTIYNSTTVPSDAGSYQLVVSVAASNAGYTGSSTAIPFTISPKELTVTDLTATERAYDGTDTVALTGGTLSGAEGGDNVSIASLPITGTTADANKGENKAVTFTAMTLTGTDAANYTLTQPVVTAKVTAKALTVDAITPTARGYDGTTEVDVSITYTGEASGETVTASGKGTLPDANAANAKTVTVTISSLTVTGNDAGNYTMPTTYAPSTVNIAKAGGMSATGAYNVSATKAQERSYTFDAKTIALNKADAGTLTYTLDTVTDNNSIIKSTSIADGVVSFTTNSTCATGNTATIAVLIDSVNYTQVMANLTVTVVDKEVVTITGLQDATTTYTGTAVSNSVFGTPAGDNVPVSELTYTYYLSDGTTQTTAANSGAASNGAAPVKAGSYKATVAVPDSNTTYIGSITRNLTIGKATITITAKDKSAYVGDTAPVLAASDYTVSGLVNNETLKTTPGTPTYVSAPDMSKAGTVAIHITGAEAPDGDNYNAIVYVPGTLTISARSSGGGGGTTTPTNPNPPTVDGKPQDIGKTEINDNTTTVTIDGGKLDKSLESAKDGSTVTVPVSTTKDSAAAKLTAESIEKLADKNMTLKVTSGKTSYTLPAASVDMNSVLNQLGATDAAKVSFTVTITNEKNAKVEGATLVVPPISFTVTATYNGKSVTVDSFSSMVARTLELTKEQASKITTAVVIENGKIVRHVPTYVYEQGGKYYAKINSMTNSTYAIIVNENAFTDTTGKWYEAAANELSAREVTKGIWTTCFDGDKAITRAELATLIVNALGLPEMTDAQFSDVSADAWYAGFVATANEYGIVSGYTDGSFKPNATITRQEAMVMMARAAKVAEYAGGSAAIGSFPDYGQIGTWAKDGVDFNLKSGLIVGKSNGTLDLTGNITRGETATVILRLLQNAELVDARAKV